MESRRGRIWRHGMYASVLPNVTGIALVTNWLSSSYVAADGPQTSLRARYQPVVVNTWSKSLDNSTLRYLAVDDPTLIKGISGSDRRQRVSITMNYNIPFARHSSHLYAKFIHEWKLNVIGVVQSGAPLTVTSGANVNGATGPNYPNLIGHPNGAGTYTQWFNTAAFQSQANFTWGNAGKVIGYGPGKLNFDTSLQREFRPLEHRTLQFRLESFNLTNTQTPGVPNTSMRSTTFGQITSISGSRQQQLGFKFLF